MSDFFEKFKYAHYPPTIVPRFEYEKEKCTSCGLCAATCPTSCIRWDETEKRPYPTGLGEMSLACIACNNCESVCPANCIRVRGEYRVKQGRYKTPPENTGEMLPPMPFGEKDLKRPFSEIEKELTETEKLLFKRRSIRLFKETPVPKEILLRILEAGRFAPSAGNGQPFKFIVVTSPDVNRLVNQKCAKVLYLIKWLYIGSQWWRRAIVTIMSLLMVNKWDQRPVSAMEKVKMTEGNITFDAPVVIHVLKDKRGISHPDIDASLAAHNLVIAAHALGLGTCYIGFIASTIRYVPSVKKILGIASPFELLTSICLGYPRVKTIHPVARGQVEVDWIEHGRP